MLMWLPVYVYISAAISPILVELFWFPNAYMRILTIYVT